MLLFPTGKAMNNFDRFSSRRDVEELLLQNSRLRGEEEAVSSVENFIRGGFVLFPVKGNLKRKVFRLRGSSGRELYLKLFAPRKFPLQFLRPYAAREYAAARELEKASVPVIRYLLWGKGENNCSFCVSEGVKNALSAREYFFKSLLKKEPGEAAKFRSALNDLIRSLSEKHFLHPDFHAGNMIFAPEEQKMLLLDPWGVRETFFRTKKAKIFLCSVWTELQDFLSDDLILSDMVNSSLCGKKIDGLPILEKARALYRRENRSRRPKIHARALAGHYRYTTVKKEEDGEYVWAHTFWYAPPEEYTVSPAWEKISFPSRKEAEARFLYFLDHPGETKSIPLMIRKEDGETVLYFADNPFSGVLQDDNSFLPREEKNGGKEEK